MGPLDILVVLAYLSAIVALGVWAGLRGQADSSSEERAKEYFLAGNHLKWPVIGLALFATNISTVQLVGLAEAGYTSGFLMGNFELLAGFTLVILAVFFAPFYIRARVATLPDFLEKRYARRRATSWPCSQCSRPSSFTSDSRSTPGPLCSMESSASIFRRRRVSWRSPRSPVATRFWAASPRWSRPNRFSQLCCSPERL